MLELLLAIILAFFGVWAFLKLVIEPASDRKARMQAQIRDLEWQRRELERDKADKK